MNLKIKYRESFRPFAPAVLAERVSDYFELDRPSPYMQLVGANRAYEPSALAVVAFIVTWGCMGIIQLFGRDRRAAMAGR